MRRRWVWIIGCVGVAVAAGVLLLMWLPQTDRVTFASYNEIKPGTDEAEIETLLGRPPDETSIPDDGRVVNGDPATGQRLVETYTSCKEWEGPQGRITLYFRDGVVVMKFWEWFDRDESLFERMRRLIGL